MSETTVSVKLPDPAGMIARVRSRMSRNCAVRQSPYCDIIISMRMQGIPLRQIEDWLTQQGPEHRISAPTILRNLKATGLRVELPYFEELAEEWGGRLDLDLARELAGQIVAQRRRVDRLQRLEEDRVKSDPGYAQKYLHSARELLMEMIDRLYRMQQTPADAAAELAALAASGKALRPKISEDALATLNEMILAGELTLDLPKEGEQPE